MKLRVSILFLAASLIFAAAAATTTAKKSRRPVPISPAVRAAARAEIERKMSAVPPGFENASALANYFAAIKDAQSSGHPVHILQFGDSHTASDDWINAMRIPAQAHYGDGGPGFIQAGRPYRGYRRFDASGTNSTGWKTEGTMAARGDANQGLSGVSISTGAAGQTVTLKASGGLLEVFYLQQPGGGQVQLTADSQAIGVFATDGDLGPGRYEFTMPPGPHEFSLRTLNFAPVRLFGWSLDNAQGVTFETLGINGAQANVLLGWNEQIFDAQVAQRKPALVVIAYGTNEANSHAWTPEQYRADLTAVIDRVRHAAPDASLLMIGPPDCGKPRPLLHLAEVIDIQREIAAAQNVAFWDWRMHMGGPGIVKRWFTAGLSQADYIHLTGEGYRLLGQTIFEQLEASSPDFHE